MEMLSTLEQSLAAVVETAASLNELYDTEENASQYASAVVLDNLRIAEDALQGKLSSASSTNMRLRCISDTFQNGILTLRDYMTAAMEETNPAETKILPAIQKLIGNLSYVLKVIAQIRMKLNDSTLPVSAYSSEEENRITSSIAFHLIHKKEPNDLVYAVRNYAIVVEVMICAELFVGYINSLHTDV